MLVNGMRIIPNPLARDVRYEWKVEPHPIPKKRKRWRVVKHYINRPGCYVMGNTLHMHPDLIAELRNQCQSYLL